MTAEALADGVGAHVLKAPLTTLSVAKVPLTASVTGGAGGSGGSGSGSDAKVPLTTPNVPKVPLVAGPDGGVER